MNRACVRKMCMTDAAQRDSAPPLFTLEGVGFAVEARVLLHPLSLDLPARRVVGLIGHNGSGKSTLLKLLARQQLPTTGHLRFEGRPLAGWGDRDFARRLAYLPQDVPAAPGLLVRELVALGRYPWHGALGRFSAADRASVAEALALTGMEPLADRLVDTLSGGERQRAWLAMLVAQQAECLLLDEPIAALDIAHQIEVLSLIHQLARQRGLGVLIVLHDINMAARFCDEIIALKAGQVTVRGSAESIMQPEILRDIYGVSMAIVQDPASGRRISYVC
jgi:ferric hydroxamate transport system ATP-binding protein